MSTLSEVTTTAGERPAFTNPYAVDGKCHNAERGTFNHECGRPATWIGKTRKGFESGFCDHCKQYGYEAKQCVEWRKS